MNISVAGPTIISTKAKEAVAFYTTHFDVVANDYGDGDDAAYWSLTFGEHSELSFMLPTGDEYRQVSFSGDGMFYSITLADQAAVDAVRARLVAGGVEASEPVVADYMYQFWITDPAGLRQMVHCIQM